MIIGKIAEEKWQIALATQNSTTVEELIDIATALDAFRNMQHEDRSRPSYGSPKFHSHNYSHSKELQKYNPATYDIRDAILVGDVGTTAMLRLCAIYRPLDQAHH
ncbi:hypothetical protein AVEN_140692-1 [Araneus ventricosus]|uniref:Uncharacterized protein n=1 Tax=Araneus ventricosus TaxID=182803 RepID=A0A4Y2C4A8_ARAVE|nr:hypothetical protein AVEN_140692-1 [Araneus ventricosus]